MIKQLREKAATYGTQSLTDIELAAVLGWKPKPNENLKDSQFLKNVHELSNRFRSYDRIKNNISSSKDAFDFITILGLQTLDIEQFYVIALNRSNNVLKSFKLSEGGTSGTVVDTKILFKKLLEVPKVCGFIITHNHPSGGLKPSHLDIEITKKINQASKLLDLSLFDHIIIGGDNYNSYTSMQDEGLF
jgi:DNA repair protein RadC